MIYEYAVDPSLLGDINNCRTIFDNFRPDRGKLIAEVPRKWLREAYKAIDRSRYSPMKRKAIVENLNRLKKQGMSKNHQLESWDAVNDSWLDYIINANSSGSFAAIFTETQVAGSVQTYALSDLFLGKAPECWKYDSQQHINRTPQAIAAAVKPLITISKQITLIDRHIYPNTPRYQSVLKEIIRTVNTDGLYGAGIDTVTIHLSDERTDMQDSLERKVLPFLPKGMKVVCHQWPKDIFHDRFIITDVGGVKFGHGLDEGHKQVLLLLLTADTKQTELSKFTGEPTITASIQNIE